MQRIISLEFTIPISIRLKWSQLLVPDARDKEDICFLISILWIADYISLELTFTLPVQKISCMVIGTAVFPTSSLAKSLLSDICSVYLLEDQMLKVSLLLAYASVFPASCKRSHQ